MTYNPLVSVFLPYYNDADFLRKSIESVLNQTYQNFELILCNHATTDNCREIAHSYDDSRIKHVDMECNEGAGGGLVFSAMLNVASGKYIKTLCADDMLKPDCLEIMVDFMESHPEVDFAFGDVEYIDDKGYDLHGSWFKSRDGFDIQDKEPDLIRKYASGISMLPYVGNISKRKIFDNIQIEKTFVMMFDMSLWLSFLCCGSKCAFINKQIVNYRIHSGQISSVDKEVISGLICLRESQYFYHILLNINNVDLAKEVFPKSKYVKQLKNVNDIPFFVAYEMFNRQKPMFDAELSRMLNDDKTREHLMKTFGFGIKELRDLRKDDFNKNKQLKKQKENIKQKVYNTSPANLGLSGLFFLILRKLFKYVTLDHFRHHKKKKYSL